MKPSRLTFAISTALAAALALAAAGVAGASGHAAARSQADCVATATAAIAKAKAPVPVSVPTAPLDMASIKGKKVWLIEVVQNDLGKAIATGFTAAGKRAGLAPTVFYGAGTSQSWNDGVAKAVAQNADAIILYGIDPQAVSAPLADAIAKKTIIIDIFNGSPSDPLPKGVYAHVTPDFKQAGINAANWMLADSKCKVQTAVFGAEVLNLHKQFDKAAKDTINNACPATCKATVENVDLGTLATAFGPQVNNVLTRRGNLNYLLIVFDGGVPLVQPAITSFSKVPIVSHDGVASNLAQIRKGGQQVYDGAFAPNEWIGWALIDQAGRGLTGSKPLKWVIPERAVDKTNIGKSDAALWANWAGYEAKFAKAWGVK